MVSIYFTDFFEVEPEILEDYGAFNISLISDLPLFIDPFLIFHSDDPEYQKLHVEIIRYVRFLRDKSMSRKLTRGELKSWFVFKEIEQNWLGFSKEGNKGSGLGMKFANSLNSNLYHVFGDFGSEPITQGSHIEKLCLIAPGVGKDNISDFTSNLIKEFLLEYTQRFAKQYIRSQYRRQIPVNRVRFNYQTQSWERGAFDLPVYEDDYVLLTPKNFLTKEETWICKRDLFNDYDDIAVTIDNDQLRALINNYMFEVLPPPKKNNKGEEKEPTQKEKNEAIAKVLLKYPQLAEYYIRFKEDRGDQATHISSEKVSETELLYISQVVEFVESQLLSSQFYKYSGYTFEGAKKRLEILIDIVEKQNGYRLFYLNDEPIKREEELQLLYRLIWFAHQGEVNGNLAIQNLEETGTSHTKTKPPIEFKLATNRQLKKFLEKKIETYQSAVNSKRALTVIVYFSADGLEKVNTILNELQFTGEKDLELLNASDGGQLINKVEDEETYDVFLSHNSMDKPIIEEIGKELQVRNLKVWLDKWNLVPGRPWQEAIEDVIETTKSAAVFIGSNGLGPWEEPEMRACLSEFVDRKLPVIPILLPGEYEVPKLPLFLKRFTWVDLRKGITKEGIDDIEWGITGKKIT